MHIFDTAIPVFWLEILVCANVLFYVKCVMLGTYRPRWEGCGRGFLTCTVSVTLSLQLTVEPAYRVYISRVFFTGALLIFRWMTLLNSTWWHYSFGITKSHVEIKPSVLSYPCCEWRPVRFVMILDQRYYPASFPCSCSHYHCYWIIF